MPTYTRPQSVPNWCADDATNCTDAPESLTSSGFTQGSVPVAEYENAYRRSLGLWIGYLDSAATKQGLTSALNLDLRLSGGGNFTYDPTANLLAWDEDLFLAVPGVPLADNRIAAGSVTLGSGALGYVTANIPTYAQASITSGDAVLRQMTSTQGIVAGQAVSGPGIADGTVVSEVADESVTMSAPATSSSPAASVAFVGTGTLVVQSTTVQSFTPGVNSVVIAVGQTSTAVVGANSGQMLIRPLEQKRLLSTGFANVVRAPAGQALASAQACYLSSGATGRTIGALYPADASAANGASRARFAGFATMASAASAPAHVVANGIIGGFTGLTIGQSYYLDPATPGAITATKPTTAGQWVVPVGSAVSTTQLLVNPAAATSAVAVAQAVAVRNRLNIDMGSVYVSTSATADQVYVLQRSGQAYLFFPDYDCSLLGITVETNVGSNGRANVLLQGYTGTGAGQSYTTLVSQFIYSPTLAQQAGCWRLTYAAGAINMRAGSGYQLSLGTSSPNNAYLYGRITIDTPA